MAKRSDNRIRTTVPILGMDTSTPDLLAKDGMQQILHNLRYAGGAWRPIGSLKQLHRLIALGDNDEPITAPDIVYHHPAGGTNHYIASGTGGGTTRLYHMVAREDGKLVFNTHSSEMLLDPPLSEKIRITHFGNVLVILDEIQRKTFYFLLDNGVYIPFAIPRAPSIRTGLFYIDSEIAPADATLLWTNGKTDPSNGLVTPFFDRERGLFHYEQISSEKPLFFWGEICCFAAFQMTDGSIVSPSPLCIISSEAKNCSIGGRELGIMARLYLARFEVHPDRIDVAAYDSTEGNLHYFANVFNVMIRPYLKICIEKENLNKNLIKYVNIYSTRINPLWDAAKLKNIKKSDDLKIIYDGFKSYRALNKLPEQPFYLAKSIPIDEFKTENNFGNLTYGLYLDASLLKDIEQNTTYTPVNAHSIEYFVTSKEYNSRLHIAGQTTCLFSGYGKKFFPPTAKPLDYSIATQVDIGDSTYFVQASSPEPLRYEYPVNVSPSIEARILSYPDYRATSMYDMDREDDAWYRLDLQQAVPNNYAYAVFEDDYESVDAGGKTRKVDYVKYSTALNKALVLDTRKIKTRDILAEPNKLLVSAPNNPFAFPLENTYAIGSDSNRILNINSAAIEMSDAKFGEFPFYAFTEEGIYALQSGGGEILYAATVPINYDRIINPETLAVNYNVIYITDRGIHALSSYQSSLLSEPINDAANQPRLDFLRKLRMCYQHPFGEIIFFDPTHSNGGSVDTEGAFVFSLANKTWSTRDFEGVKLNTHEVFLRDSSLQVLLLDLDREELRPEASVIARLISRPIKFGSVEFKRLETIILRIRASEPTTMRLTLAASVDLKNWVVLRDSGPIRSSSDPVIRRTPLSFRYLRVRVEIILLDDIEFTGMDIEYYLRFLHRLR